MSTPPIANAPAQAVPAHYRRNLFLLVGDFVFFVVGITFINGQTVLPDFVGRLTGSEVLVGLVSITFPLGVILPQLAFAPVVARSKAKRLWVLWPGIPGRMMVFVPAIAIMVFGADQPLLLVTVVFLSVGFFAACDGVSALGWLDLIGMVLPNERRGRMFGIGRMISSLIILFVVSDLMRQILAPEIGPSFPYDYALLFALGAVCLVVSVVAFIFIREHHSLHAEALQVPAWRDYLAFLRSVLRDDRSYRRYLTTRVIAEVALIATPFYIRFATESLSIPSADAVSGAIQMSTLGGVIAGLGLGWLSERRGSRLVILVGALVMVAQPITALVAGGTGMTWLIYLAFAIGGMTFATIEPGLLNWIIEYADNSRRAIYYSLTSTINFVAVLSPLLGGLIAERLSYEVLFVVALALALITLAMALSLIEPRKQRLGVEAEFAVGRAGKS